MKMKELSQYLSERYKENTNIYIMLQKNNIQDYCFFSEEELIDLAQHQDYIEDRFYINDICANVETVEQAIEIIQDYDENVEILKL